MLAFGEYGSERVISLIRPEGHYYRGQPVAELVESGRSLEEVARLLWDCGEHDPFALPAPAAWPPAVRSLLREAALPALERTAAALPLTSMENVRPATSNRR